MNDFSNLSARKVDKMPDLRRGRTISASTAKILAEMEYGYESGDIQFFATEFVKAVEAKMRALASKHGWSLTIRKGEDDGDTGVFFEVKPKKVKATTAPSKSKKK